MKKLLLFSLLLSFGVGIQAQSGYKKINHPDVNKGVKASFRIHNEAPVAEMDFTPSTAIVSTEINRGANGVTEAVIMNTFYDLQTNASLSNRMIAFPDGSVAATAIRGVEAMPDAPDRGTGYNYYDGSDWGDQPTARVEPFRSGWPSIAPLGDNGEILVSHGGIPFGIHAYSRETKGTGDWTELGLIADFPAPWEGTWPRIVTTGENNEIVHVVAADQDAADLFISQVFYNRSEDAGQNWQGWENVPEVDFDFYNYNISADDYTMAANGNTVAILFASAWYDLFFVKSTDNGETWEKTVIWEHPYPTFDLETDITTDTLYTVDNSANIAIDDDGMVHVVWGTGRVLIEVPDGGAYTYFPYVGGIGYWNESMGEIPTNPENPHKTMDPEYLESLGTGMIVGWTPDLNNNEVLDVTLNFDVNYRTLGLSTQPAISIDNNGTIAIFYSAPNEERLDESDYNYRSLYATYKDGIYGSWYYVEEDITAGFIHLFDEVYNVTSAPIAYDGTFHAMYQADNIIGLEMDAETPANFTDNKIYVSKITPVIIGVNEQINPVSELSSVYPNPVKNKMNVDVNLSKAVKNAKVEVHNITGQLIYTESNSLFTGLNKVSVDVSSFDKGVYFFTLNIDGYKETKKFVVN
jgi:hypothetical protein